MMQKDKETVRRTDRRTQSSAVSSLWLRGCGSVFGIVELRGRKDYISVMIEMTAACDTRCLK